MQFSKIVVFGNKKAGKTQLVRKIIAPENPFLDKHQATIGANLHLLQRDEITMQLWDIAGNSHTQLLGNACYERASLGVYCVDLSEPVDHSKITADLMEFKAVKKNSNTTLILVGTKTDLCPLDAKDLLDGINIEGVATRIVTSAKDNTGLKELVESLSTFSPKELPLLDSIIAKLPEDSLLYLALENLAYYARDLPDDKYQAIGVATNEFLIALQRKEDKTKALENFVNRCNLIVEGKNPKLMKAVFAVAITSAILIIVASSWMGLGIAISIAGAWGSLGLATGGLAACGFFKHEPLVAAVDQFVVKINNQPIDILCN